MPPNSQGNPLEDGTYALPNFGIDSSARGPAISDTDGNQAYRSNNVGTADSGYLSHKNILERFYSMRSYMSLEERILAGEFKAYN